MRVVRWIAVGLVAVVILAAGVAYLNATSLTVWYTTRNLCYADDNSRSHWIDQVTALGDLALPGLLTRIIQGDDRAAENCLAAIDHLAQVNGPTHPTTGQIVHLLAERFSALSPTRKSLVLTRVRHWLTGSAPDSTFLASARLLVRESGQITDPEVQSAALELAFKLVRQPGASEAMVEARVAAQAGLQSPSAAVRLSAIRVCLEPGVDLLASLVMLLKDPAVEIRRAAILAIGSDRDAIGEDSLIQCLHDEDAEVRRLADVALKGRGLKPELIELGRLLTHPRPAERLLVLDHITTAINTSGQHDIDIDPGLWLRRLSQDPSPNVRVATLRLMCQQKLVDLRDRVEQMASNDLSPTVAHLARYYLATNR